MASAYKPDIEKHILKQIKDQATELAQSDPAAYWAQIEEFDCMVMSFDPDMLWARVKTLGSYRDKDNKLVQPVVYRVGYVQTIHLSTGKVRVACSLGGCFDTTKFELLNPEALSSVLERSMSEEA